MIPGPPSDLTATRRADPGGGGRPTTVVEKGDVLAVVGSDLDIAAFLQE